MREAPSAAGSPDLFIGRIRLGSEDASVVYVWLVWKSSMECGPAHSTGEQNEQGFTNADTGAGL